MYFDKEPKSEENKTLFFFFFFFFLGGGGGGRGWREGEEGGFQPKNTKNNNRYSLIFVLMLYIKFQVPGLRGSLV